MTLSFTSGGTLRILTRNTLKMNNPHKLPDVIRRYYSKDMNKQKKFTNLIEAKEIKFPLPYGHLAAKEWGDPNGLPVLAVHGWLDNAGSFDPLAPFLVKENNMHIIAIDEPGVGFSSHKPPGSEYGRWSTLMEMKRVIDHMQWSKCTVIGHSQGGHYALLFAAVYPKIVERVISIDIFKPLTYHGEKWANRVEKMIDMHMKLENSHSNDPSVNTKIPVYSEPDAVKRMMEAHGNSLTEESARILMIRGTKQQKWGLTFSRDIRLKLPSLDPMPTDEQILRFMENIRGDCLIIRAKHGPYHVPEHIRRKYYDVYERNCRIFKDLLLDGTHHLHMNNPDTVGAAINEFVTESLTSNLKANL